MKQPFEDVVRDMIDDGRPPICVISDFFIGWTLESCHLFGIPRVVSHALGVFSMAVSRSPSLRVPSVKDLLLSDPIEFSEMKIPFILNKSDIPAMLFNIDDPNNPFVRLIKELGVANRNSWGVIVNSFEEIDGEYVGAFESHYFN